MRVFNKEHVFSVLLEGSFSNDKASARKHGVSATTVSLWRKRVFDNDELRQEFEERLATCRKEWLTHAPSALTAGIKAFQSVAEFATLHPDQVGSDLFGQLVGGLHILSKVTIAQRYADVRLAALQRQLDAPAENLDYLPDVKQIEAYKPSENGHNGNGHVNGQVIEAEVVRDENDPIS